MNQSIDKKEPKKNTASFTGQQSSIGGFKKKYSNSVFSGSGGSASVLIP